MNIKIFIIVTTIVLLAIPTIIVTKFNINCNNKYDVAKNASQPLIESFDKIALLGEQPAQKTNVERGGDCIDSDPYVIVSKNYNSKVSGAQAVDSVRNNLKQSGYTITNEDFGREGCKLLYRVKAENGNVKIYVVAYQKNIKDNTCSNGSPTGVSENYFRSQNIDTTSLNLRN